MAIKLYSTPYSPPCQAVLLVGHCLGLKFEIIETSPMKEETKTQEYIQMNPQHTIPTLVDADGYTIWESRAIGRYLAQKYGSKDLLYPKDLKKRINVDKMLDFDLGTLYKRFIDYIMPILSTGKPDETAVPKLDDSLNVLEICIQKNSKGWVATDQFTIADIYLFVTTNCLLVLNYNFENYPLITKWMSSVKSSIPNYDTVGVPLEENFKSFVLCLLK